jgi:rhodanese-related sulfurtransferase
VAAPTQVSISTSSNLLSPPPIPLSITWVEAKPWIAEGKAVLIDARHRPNFEAGHIPGAISLPITSTIEELEAFQKEYPPETRLIVYCGNASCALSKRLAEQLVNQYRFQNVHYMIGGYQEWQQAELAAPKPGT